MQITQEQRDVLAHKVVDPQAWADHAEATFGLEKATKMLEDKVARWKPEHDAKVSAGNYKNRVQKDAEEKQAELDRWAPDLATAKTKRKKEINGKISKLFSSYVDPHYLKKNRHAERSKLPKLIPASVETYEDALSANQDAANLAIDALTTVQAVKDYQMASPTPPVL